MEQQVPGKVPKLAYRGPELYEGLLDHARAMGAGYAKSHSSPDERMEMLSRRVAKSCEGYADTEAMYEVAIWTLLHRREGEFQDRHCPRMLCAAASRGHVGARYVMAKACLERVYWAIDELHRCSRDGNPYGLAREWMRELSERGYDDARVEWASELWESGNEGEATDLFATIVGESPDALSRLGLYQLAKDTESGLRHLDAGEDRSVGKSVVSELESALHTS